MLLLTLPLTILGIIVAVAAGLSAWNIVGVWVVSNLLAGALVMAFLGPRDD